MSRPRPKIELKDDNEWMMTYSDAITLLLAFFVLIVAVSQVNEGKLEDLKDGWGKVVDAEAHLPMKELTADIQEIVEQKNLDSVVVTAVTDGIRIDLDSENLYDSGSASLKPEGKTLIAEFAKAMKEVDLIGRSIIVEGHSDDLPIHSKQFDSNWELSGARAIEVTKQLIKFNVDKSQLRAVAYADVQPRADKALPIEQQRQLNRRVVIYIKRN
ncbi:flagellar motor protein MotB [Aliivibrio finisterrensis]|uniref:OmpA/MotB family protein n=1 Tax=Aliivibrio finisterrensis TaxID=511998 RepID=UPI00101F4D8A|nr:OmpA family protein [Aliivibrio finisterrensis]RYU70400.1 flagellar motor protein MotB [Aliivibrio finisterrensis]RYU74262.1 flagellar motor protein MotB [Aliivibrio finisterrensis]RYU76867.1 flagellar motor protein MotB [Aliivibrio finisterrensis]